MNTKILRCRLIIRSPQVDSDGKCAGYTWLTGNLVDVGVPCNDWLAEQPSGDFEVVGAEYEEIRND